jgi:hypothetical protein
MLQLLATLPDSHMKVSAANSMIRRRSSVDPELGKLSLIMSVLTVTRTKTRLREVVQNQPRLVIANQNDVGTEKNVHPYNWCTGTKHVPNMYQATIVS